MSQTPPPALSAEALDDARRHAVASMWAFRARGEHEATARFARLSKRLELQGAQQVVCDLARRAIDDEARHRTRCAQLAERYGHPTMHFDHASVPSEVAPASLSPRERVLYEVVAFCCITESINRALLKITLEEAREPETRDAVRSILKDEIAHAKLGWAHLAAERKAGHGDRLGTLAPRMLAGTVSEELFAMDASVAQHDRDLMDHGVLPLEMLQQIFTETLNDVVFPGFEAFRVETTSARAWLKARTS